MSTPPIDTWIGRTLEGRYEILEVIGEGGMGVVYRARQTSIDREVAIKMLHARAARDPQAVVRFHQEAKACSRLAHPNTVRLFDFGQTAGGKLYMVMELLTGKSLRTAVAREAPMDERRVLRILVQACASLMEAHGVGIIHRDIKPDNVFLPDHAGIPDFVKLLDFSVAKLLQESVATAAGLVFGTPQYMSPEQGLGHPLDARSDLYALGILAYEMLTKNLPFDHNDPMVVLHMHRSRPVPDLPDEVSLPMQSLVMKCLSKSREDRPESALAVLQECRAVLSSLEPASVLAHDPVWKDTLVTETQVFEPEQPRAPVTDRGPGPGRPPSVNATMLGTAPSTLTGLRPGIGPGPGGDHEGADHDPTLSRSRAPTDGRGPVASTFVGHSVDVPVPTLDAPGRAAVPAWPEPAPAGLSQDPAQAPAFPVHANARPPFAAVPGAVPQAATSAGPQWGAVPPRPAAWQPGTRARGDRLFWLLCAVASIGAGLGAYYAVTALR